jgi:hypothetical protein
MATSSSRGSAKILEFPTRARVAAVGRREAARTAAEVKPAPAPVIFYDGWYHEEAMRDGQPWRKR